MVIAENMRVLLTSYDPFPYNMRKGWKELAHTPLLGGEKPWLIKYRSCWFSPHKSPHQEWQNKGGCAWVLSTAFYTLLRSAFSMVGFGLFLGLNHTQSIIIKAKPVVYGLSNILFLYNNIIY